MNSQLARIYVRQFKNADDAAAFITASHVISERISAVDVKYRLYQIQDDPTILYEIWEYPDDDSMKWVQSSMEGATPKKTSNIAAVKTTAKIAVSISKA